MLREGIRNEMRSQRLLVQINSITEGEVETENTTASEFLKYHYSMLTLWK